MAARSFIDYFCQHQNSELTFEKFRNEILILITPTKLKLETNVDRQKLVSVLRDAVVSNLGFIPFFYKCNFSCDDLKNLYQILLDTDILQIDRNHLAKLTFLLHLSKANIDDKNTWNKFFNLLYSINIIETSEWYHAGELHQFFENLKRCKKLTGKILAVAQELTEIDKINFNFIDLEVNFTASLILGLNGFSGKNAIYIDLNELSRKYNGLKVTIGETRSLNVLKFECLRLFIHESCHVLIRHQLNDLNLSSPKLSKFGSNRSLPEAGIAAEEKIFTNRIDWLTSAAHFSYEYCLDYLTDLLDGKNVSFDFEKSNCMIDTSQMYLMAIDYKIPSPDFY
ncbi:hypothetical protein BpHYR1_040586 [Brachionus plicatilis]|uniref:Uncharacterized protein n=1 Tax=Brachionus plicatilis TaxID=10195 RepID=A0A3M7T0J0_BRAPC|nr:hypothetical protein BpHYR1_040586 [Brachionus plicatilis]